MDEGAAGGVLRPDVELHDPMTDRRTFLRGAGAAFVPAIAPGLAQPQGRPARIGYISFRPGPNEFEQSFVRGLRERGWVERQNLAIDFRSGGVRREPRADDGGRTASTATCAGSRRGRSLRGMIGRTTRPCRSCTRRSATRSRTGVTTNLARPDGNVTGVSVLATELACKRIELLKASGSRLGARRCVLQRGALRRRGAYRPAWRPARNSGSRWRRCRCVCRRGSTRRSRRACATAYRVWPSCRARRRSPTARRCASCR